MNEKLKSHQMKIVGLSIFFLNHKPEIHRFIYAHCMSQVVKDWQSSQAKAAAGDYKCSWYFLLKL